MNLNLSRDNLDEIIAAIKQRKNVDFCVIYEYLAHEQLLALCFLKNKELITIEQIDNSKKLGITTNTNSTISSKHKDRLSRICEKLKNPRLNLLNKQASGGFQNPNDRILSTLST